MPSRSSRPSGAMQRLNEFGRRIEAATKHPSDALLYPAALMFVIQLLQVPVGLHLNSECAIVPRTVRGLTGIITMPFCHHGWGHYQGNMVGWYILGTQVTLDGVWPFAVTFVVVTIWSGTLLWIFGRPHTATVGLSGVLFAFWGLMLAAVPLKRPFSTRRLMTALVVSTIYVPSQFLLQALPEGAAAGTSWDGHLCGLAAGILWALIYFREWRCKGVVVGGLREHLRRSPNPALAHPLLAHHRGPALCARCAARM